MEIYCTQKTDRKGERILRETEEDEEIRTRINFMCFYFFVLLFIVCLFDLLHYCAF